MLGIEIRLMFQQYLKHARVRFRSHYAKGKIIGSKKEFEIVDVNYVLESAFRMYNKKGGLPQRTWKSPPHKRMKKIAVRMTCG